MRSLIPEAFNLRLASHTVGMSEGRLNHEDWMCSKDPAVGWLPLSNDRNKNDDEDSKDANDGNAAAP